MKNFVLLIFLFSTFIFGQVKYKNELHISTETDRGQQETEIGMASNGDFVVAWESRDQDGDNLGIYVQRYDSSGTKIGTEISVNTTTDEEQGNPDIAVALDGSFIVTWESNLQEGALLGFGIYGQRFDPSGVKVGSEFHVNTFDSLDQVHPSVDVDENGNFVIVWESNGQDADSSFFNVYGQIYGSDGVKIGIEFRVDTFTNVNSNWIQRFPDIDVNLDGSFIVV